MGGVFSRANYTPNPGRTGNKTGCTFCSCSPFKTSTDPDASKETVPLVLPKPPVFVPGANDTTAKDSQILSVKEFNSQVKLNADEHHTNEYHLVEKDNPNLVVRRGQPFQLQVSFNRKYDAEEDVINFVFIAQGVTNPTYSQGTLVSVPLFGDLYINPKKDWSAKLISSKDDTTVTVAITTPPNVIVGIWSIDIDTKLKKGNEEALRFSYQNPMYILFNPWCEDDTVFIGEEERRQEYVLSDSGLIWRGGHNRLRPTPWSYAQFEESVLECSIYLLNSVGKLRKTAHSDPVLVSRHLSGVINDPDDSGVIVGNWSGDYKGGQPPTKWAGSQEILQQFYKTQKSVKFGQCWVFAGVLTTVCRALGIPCRPVTNFSSAHDTHQSLTVDYFCNDKGDRIENLTTDSVWNFHVWNEVWMERPDLEPGQYGGWQAIDSTPQESSDGQYRCGPASVAAIKRGEVKKSYDGEFLFAEVNADKVFWIYRGPTQPLKLLNKLLDAIGINISTKAIGKFEREDITSNYKHPESSRDERDTMLTALRQTRSMYSRYYLNDDFEDINFDFQLNDDIVIGRPFKVVLKIHNKSPTNDYNITSSLRVDTMLYTGKIKNQVRKETFDLFLKAGKVEELQLDVQYEEYAKHLEDQAAFNIAAMATVKETGFEYFGQDDFRVRMPDIIITTEGDLIQGQEFTVNAHFLNPLPRKLKRGEFSFEGPGLGSPLKIKLIGDVEPNAEAIASCKLTPKLSGEKSIVAKFTSKELNDVDGFLTIFIAPSSRDQNGVNSSNVTPPGPEVNEVVTAA